MWLLLLLSPLTHAFARVVRAAEEGGFSYSIVRPGQIKGEPFLVYSKDGPAISPDAPVKGSAKRMVSLRQGDTEAGDVNPSSVAEAFTQVTSRLERKSITLSLSVYERKHKAGE